MVVLSIGMPTHEYSVLKKFSHVNFDTAKFWTR
jgi:hypothetical protein